MDLLGCSVALMMLHQPSAGDADRLRAASCDVPASTALVEKWLGPTWVDVEQAELSFAVVAPRWIAVDGVLLERPADSEGTRWLASRTLPAGTHLVQVGLPGAERASAAVLVEVGPAERSTWAVIPELGHTEVVQCTPEGFDAFAGAVGSAELHSTDAEWLAGAILPACGSADAVDFDLLRAHTVSAARTRWAAGAETAADLALRADPDAWLRWRRRQLRFSRALAIVELLSLAGHVTTEIVTWEPDGRLQFPALVARAPQLSLAAPLIASGLRRETLVRGGQATPKAALVTGTLFATASMFFPNAQRVFGDSATPYGGAGRALGALLVGAQIVQNHWSQRRLRKRLKAARGAQIPEGE